MTVHAAAQVTGINYPPGTLPQPITVVVNVNTGKEKEDKQESEVNDPANFVYSALELLTHHAMIFHISDVNDIATPIYQTAYLMSAVAGAAFGLYKAMNGNTSTVIGSRATAFAEGDLLQKGFALTKLASIGPLALIAAEARTLAPGLTAGSLVASYWGFNLGSDAATMAYHYLVSKPQSKE